ncbi:Glutaredoxin domain-containing protein [Rhizoctonia solani AG-1 IA]|uniref:Glutaredoxin domain-containing protein n=1 Tax=Thanatephorus cucumeris (strain AG1-IA) TaxID=983506 RepID=L8WMN1_THACA|nr:Glutaredoxin domain-containing protein [Rhizoctonia solani AG-1 IA]
MITRSFITLAHRTSSIPRLPPATRSPLRFFPLASLFATTSSGPTAQQKLNMTVQDTVNNAITTKDGKKKIAIFSKTYCPYCLKAKSRINTYVSNLAVNEKDQVEVVILELDELEDGGAIQNHLQEKTNQRTVPNIFIGKFSLLSDGMRGVGTDDPIAEKHIGGSSDLEGYKDADIKKLLFGTAAS